MFTRNDTRAPEWWRGLRAALVVAHPGHELRVHHWLEQARPVVLTLTDGSGHAGVPRLAATAALLERAGARPSAFFGRLSDKELYDAVLGGRTALFRDLVREIADVLESAGVDYVAGDAAEGFNPGHDVCRLLLNAALPAIRDRRGRDLPNFEFPLDGPPPALALRDRSDAIVLDLDDAAFDRKLRAAEAYAELGVDVKRLLAAHGAAAFRVECLGRVRYGLDIADRFEFPPFYERYGEQRVREGRYERVIRYRDHLAPLAESLAGDR